MSRVRYQKGNKSLDWYDEKFHKPCAKCYILECQLKECLNESGPRALGRSHFRNICSWKALCANWKYNLRALLLIEMHPICAPTFFDLWTSSLGKMLAHRPGKGRPACAFPTLVERVQEWRKIGFHYWKGLGCRMWATIALYWVKSEPRQIVLVKHFGIFTGTL